MVADDRDVDLPSVYEFLDDDPIPVLTQGLDGRSELLVRADDRVGVYPIRGVLSSRLDDSRVDQPAAGNRVVLGNELPVGHRHTVRVQHRSAPVFIQAIKQRGRACAGHWQIEQFDGGGRQVLAVRVPVQ